MTKRLAAPSRQMSRINEDGDAWCPKCQQWRDRGDFHQNANRPSGLDGWCRPCKNAQERERAARKKAQRPPKPRPLTAPGDGLAIDLSARHGKRRLNAPWPSADPRDCVHPGVAVYAEEALPFLRECVAAELCLGIVRGYVASVGQEATGLVAPRFARKSSAQLWNNVMRHHTGRRA